MWGIPLSVCVKGLCVLWVRLLSFEGPLVFFGGSCCVLASCLVRVCVGRLSRCCAGFRASSCSYLKEYMQTLNVNETTLAAIDLTEAVGTTPNISTPFGGIDLDLLDDDEICCVFFFLVNLLKEGAEAAANELQKVSRYVGMREMLAA